MKFYYTHRQDMWDNAKMKEPTEKQIEDKTVVYDFNEVPWVPATKGWRGHVDDMARRFVLKLLISHGTQIILESYGETFPKHHNFVPPKPTDKERAMRICDMFRETRNILLEDQNRFYAENGRIMIGKEVMADVKYIISHSI